jgi:hypothetical protein
MRLRPVLGVVTLVASLPLMGFASAPPSATAANVSISVSAAESCIWYLENLPTVINLESETKFKGEPLSISGTISAAIGFSGNAAVSDYSTQCSFFNSSLTTKKLTVSLVGSEFIARYSGTRDNSLSFGVDERPLVVQTTSDGLNCPQVDGLPAAVSPVFQWGPINNIDNLVRAVDLVTYSSTPNVGEKNHFLSGEAAKCSPELELSVEIRSNQPGPPAGAGLTYVFTGPVLEFTLNNN